MMYPARVAAVIIIFTSKPHRHKHNKIRKTSTNNKTKQHNSPNIVLTWGWSREERRRDDGLRTADVQGGGGKFNDALCEGIAKDNY